MRQPMRGQIPQDQREARPTVCRAEPSHGARRNGWEIEFSRLPSVLRINDKLLANAFADWGWGRRGKGVLCSFWNRTTRSLTHSLSSMLSLPYLFASWEHTRTPTRNCTNIGATVY